MKISDFLIKKFLTAKIFLLDYTANTKKLSDTTITLCETDLAEEDYRNIWYDVEQNLIKFPLAADLFAVVFTSSWYNFDIYLYSLSRIQHFLIGLWNVFGVGRCLTRFSKLTKHTIQSGNASSISS